MSGETAGQTAVGLRRDAIGLREVLFQSITAMAPAAAVAASIPSGAAFAGGSLPLSVLIALVACLCTASCVAELARELPSAGSVSTTAVAVAAVLGLGFAYDPVTAFMLLATVIVTVVIGVYIVVDLACAGYFLRRRREALKPVRHLPLPGLGIVTFVPALLTAAGLPVFDFVSELTAPASYAGTVVGVWMAAGTVVLVVLLRRHPGRIAETARVHLDDPSPTGLPQNGAVQR
ncbi:hypothetical protein [Streptomyces viridochromogenes]|uniref:hypothetical protein n=1 Tax=Streptomyces viridochromogenes TaxID=1938 RepID=UPI00099B90D9|nr:hypothetical protein [Streptomyces viridochromogenes]